MYHQTVRQGDVLLIPTTRTPTGRKVKREQGKLILQRGEATGHHHYIASPHAVLFRPDDAGTPGGGIPVLVIKGDNVMLEHQEHSPDTLEKIKYDVIIQTEFVDQKLRQVED